MFLYVLQYVYNPWTNPWICEQWRLSWLEVELTGGWVDWRLSWLEAELTTNYACIRKLVKICDQFLGPCRLSNLSALAGNMELVPHLVWSCYHYSRLPPPPPTSAVFLKKSVIWIDSKVVFIVIQSWRGSVMVMREPRVLTARPSCVTLLQWWCVSGGIIWVELTCMWMNGS